MDTWYTLYPQGKPKDYRDSRRDSGITVIHNGGRWYLVENWRLAGVSHPVQGEIREMLRKILHHKTTCAELRRDYNQPDHR